MVTWRVVILGKIVLLTLVGPGQSTEHNWFGKTELKQVILRDEFIPQNQRAGPHLLSCFLDFGQHKKFATGSCLALVLSQPRLRFCFLHLFSLEGRLMKRDREVAAVVVLPRHILDRFYREFFHTAIDVIVELGTCGGMFELSQREIVPRVDTLKGASYQLRFDVYTNKAEVEANLQKVCPSTLQFGPIFPGHHLEQQPVIAPKLEPVFQLNKDIAHPRYFERNTAFKSGMASPFGEVVVDVDFDYDREGICNCGLAKQVCSVCWRVFMDPAQLVLDYIYDYFGLKARFRSFSGRRGFHDWLINKRMILMTTAQRAAFFQSIQWQNFVPGSDLYKGTLAILTPLFEANHVLRSRFTAPVADSESPLYKEAYAEAIFNNLYPKMDRAVTTDPTHLHTLPLTLHPERGTLRVLMLPVRNPKFRFDPATDTIKHDCIRMQHIEMGMGVIMRAVDILKKEL